MSTVMREAELIRIVAVYECDVCGREYALNEGEDYTGIPEQGFMHRCDEEE
ncbi:hypothetical protein [Streptomyces hydrogenans]|uniref:Uncharacterized protein n=1 Tax=Streptomyces hydrogenans TaxID=1873719 RepID=A0ABQ3PJM5_9ACTN|nr:hypothetical protein [Streptomyces hydrogenans]GHG09939.1 hypothetical protein GCM10018784_23240 [Streptomyces hydrogenans]GHI25224.1 hypothetical protein Shyd_65950 [Streptomyces hydrogenans]